MERRMRCGGKEHRPWHQADLGSSPSWITGEVISGKSLPLVSSFSFLISKLVPAVQVCHEDEMR